jgi:hypothetical protein
MKKICILFSFLFLSCMMQAQILNSIGINVGANMSEEYWRVHTDAHHVPYYYDDDQRWKYSWNLGIFAELFQNEHFRWDTEIQYNHKGGIDIDKTHKAAALATTNTHLCWNNYLKFRWELYQGTPYVLLGIRIEDVLSTSTASPPIASQGPFVPIQLTPAVGVGWEFVTYGAIKPFIEYIYNPSPVIGPPSYHNGDLTIWNREMELRVGIRIELQGGKETCPKVYQ